jgi:carbamoyltransferase
MIILGINGGIRMGYQDVAAAIVKDGYVIAAVEEERCNRIKHSPGKIPYLSVAQVLELASITIHEVDYIATHGSTWGDAYNQVLKEYFNRYFGYCPEIVKVHHHVAHAASAYYASGFDEAMVLTLDASGDGIAMQKAIGKGRELVVKEQIPRTNSLGIFYAMMTQFCGFTRDEDEYKLMGLAPYGNPNQYDLSPIIDIHSKGYTFHNQYIKSLEVGQPQPTKQEAIFTNQLTNLLGPSRIPGTPITEKYKDLAAATQQKLTEAVIAIVQDFQKSTGLRKLCLAGGVALNCAANQFLMELDGINDLYIQPAAGDSGIALGAAYWVAKEMGDTPKPMQDVYLGKAQSNDEIKKMLLLSGINFTKSNEPHEEAARLVADNKVVGWFQNRMEFGPRALGNRSILANPLALDMKQRINAKIKFRESFRPFCPSVVEEDFNLFFKGKLAVSPYMTINFEVKNPESLPSSTHVDATARVQSVNAHQNPLFYQYLQALKNEIGVGISINTSFNRNNEPIVASVIDAISAYYGSGMDALVIGNYVLRK